MCQMIFYQIIQNGHNHVINSSNFEEEINKHSRCSFTYVWYQNIGFFYAQKKPEKLDSIHILQIPGDSSEQECRGCSALCGLRAAALPREK